jgi:hypothetical protein
MAGGGNQVGLSALMADAAADIFFESRRRFETDMRSA